MKTTPVAVPQHGGQMRQIADRYGVPMEELVDFSANINPAGPPPGVLEVVRTVLEVPETLTAYPDLELAELKEAIAGYTSTRPENIAVSNGFVPLLDIGLRSLRATRCLLPVPSFSEYRRTLENAGVDVVPYCLSMHDEFAYRPDDLLQAAVMNSCDSILLANPQNPSGALCASKQVLRLITMAAEKNISVFLDEAFIDYSISESILPYAVEMDNLIVFRSVTKFFACPGLRVAYAIGASSTARKIDRLIAPWPVASIASTAICAALRDERYAEQARVLNHQRRAWLVKELCRLSVATYLASANFLLLRFPMGVDVDLIWERMIIEEHLVLRTCANFEGLETGHLRIAVRSETENERLVRGLERVLNQHNC